MITRFRESFKEMPEAQANPNAKITTVIDCRDNRVLLKFEKKPEIMAQELINGI